jgi:hypothetical protein
MCIDHEFKSRKLLNRIDVQEVQFANLQTECRIAQKTAD